jgi:hypothetical protein
MEKTIKVIGIAALLTLIGFSFVSCGDSDDSGGGSGGSGGGDNTVAVTDVTLDKPKLSLTVGKTETLTATVSPDNASNKSVTWLSSAPAIATVSDSGTVTAIAAGNATIIISTKDGGKIAFCAVTVTDATVYVTGVTLDKTELSLIVGNTETLTATVSPDNAANKSVTWLSSAPAIATVSDSGAVTAIAAGNATITVRTADGDKTATCVVTVSAPITPNGLAAHLASLPVNTASTPHNISLKVSNTSEFTTIKTALNGAAYKYVYLDLTGSTITAIPDYAFNTGAPSYTGCATLIGVTIPDSITSIGVYAFAYCARLASVTLGSGVTNIGLYAFIYCAGLATINVHSENSAYIAENGILFNKNKSTLIAYPAGKATSSIVSDIPNSVTSIGEAAFGTCTRLTSVTIPDSVTSIGDNAFAYCNNLASVTLGSSVTSIGYYAFNGCTRLASVTFQGAIPSSGFDMYAFNALGDLRDKFYAVDLTNGTSGTYTRASGSGVWTPQ